LLKPSKLERPGLLGLEWKLGTRQDYCELFPRGCGAAGTSREPEDKDFQNLVLPVSCQTLSLPCFGSSVVGEISLNYKLQVNRTSLWPGLEDRLERKNQAVKKKKFIKPFFPVCCAFLWWWSQPSLFKTNFMSKLLASCGGSMTIS